MNLKNLIINTDGYKFSHYLQYPTDSETAYSYIESRGGKFDKVTFFGLLMFIKDYLLTPITHADINEAEEIIVNYGLPFNRKDWEIIVNEYNGYLPIQIEALPEGTTVPVSTPLVQVCNTDTRFPWLPSYIETALLRAVWYPTTVATYSNRCKSIIKKYLELTGCSLDALDIKLHDFGARGSSSYETACIGGLAHLVNFKSTDTVSALLYSNKFYNSQNIGFSIPAAEHSTITSWGKTFEIEAYRNMLKQFKDGMFAVVTDSYDHFNAIRHLFGNELHDAVVNHKGGIVFRPDSGNPTKIVPQTIKVLMNKFGYTHTSTGHLILKKGIRVIQGDGVSYESINEILKAMHFHNLAADNVAFGMGGELLQKTHRDVQRFAMKMSAIRVKGVWRDVFKDPVTAPNKKSKKGILSVIKTDSGYSTQKRTLLNKDIDLLQPIFFNGNLLREDNFEVIRERVLDFDMFNK